MKIHEKLVRDNIPDIIKAKGGQPKFRILSPDLCERALRAKLVEEGYELIGAVMQGEVLRESADILEVLYKFWELRGISYRQVERERKRIRKERGGFDKMIFLESVG